MTSERATGRDVILAIGENMRSSLEPLVTKILAPSLYQVYLHGDDYDRMRSIFKELETEATQLLDQELDRLNRQSAPAWDRFIGPLLRKKADSGAAEPSRKVVSAEGRWSIRFQEDPNGTLAPGEIEVVSEFAHEPDAAYGAGSKTHRISTTRRLGGEMTVRRETMDTQAAYARIVYQDDSGPHTFLMTKDEIVIGREAPDVWVDLRLETSLDVSREHARLQRTPEGTFRVKDLSKLGTTINGVPLPRSLEAADGGVRDLDRWADLPDKARIGLAGVVFLDFERLGRG
ncbi:MAG TPA: FHA domain-containing protein [Thermoanaerobaculia bacterium]|nr:FHA domain-containing protein [Thermoanaerobaculia bacterium]